MTPSKVGFLPPLFLLAISLPFPPSFSIPERAIPSHPPEEKDPIPFSPFFFARRFLELPPLSLLCAESFFPFLSLAQPILLRNASAFFSPSSD